MFTDKNFISNFLIYNVNQIKKLPYGFQGCIMEYKIPPKNIFAWHLILNFLVCSTMCFWSLKRREYIRDRFHCCGLMITLWSVCLFTHRTNTHRQMNKIFRQTKREYEFSFNLLLCNFQRVSRAIKNFCWTFFFFLQEEFVSMLTFLLAALEARSFCVSFSRWSQNYSREANLVVEFVWTAISKSGDSWGVYDYDHSGARLGSLYGLARLKSSVGFTWWNCNMLCCIWKVQCTKALNARKFDFFFRFSFSTWGSASER